jgi:hypothetical protein
MAAILLEKQGDSASRDYAGKKTNNPDYKPFEVQKSDTDFSDWKTRDGKPFIPKSSTPKSKLLRNLGIGAGALTALGLGGYGVYRALHKEEPNKKQANMQKIARIGALSLFIKSAEGMSAGAQEHDLWPAMGVGALGGAGIGLGLGGLVPAIAASGISAPEGQRARAALNTGGFGLLGLLPAGMAINSTGRFGAAERALAALGGGLGAAYGHYRGTKPKASVADFEEDNSKEAACAAPRKKSMPKKKSAKDIADKVWSSTRKQK